jgi:hypothetical protein
VNFDPEQLSKANAGEPHRMAPSETGGAPSSSRRLLRPKVCTRSALAVNNTQLETKEINHGPKSRSSYADSIDSYDRQLLSFHEPVSA